MAAHPQGGKTELGREQSGLAFRLLWFESADERKPAAITRFIFPAGTSYPSQVIRKSLPIYPGAKMVTDDADNLSMSYPEQIVVEPGRPVLLGFVADVSFLGPAYRVVDRDRVSWKRKIPASVARTYLRDEAEYDLQDPGIQEVVLRLTRDRPDPVAQLGRIWEFVHGHMRYDLPPRPNTGAETLQLGKGLCGEYTRLTATLSRACGLAARETHAFGMFSDGPARNDHAWADVFLPGAGWTPVQAQEDPPGAPRYPLHYYRYLVVYRGISFVENERVIEHTNVIQHGPSGVGFLADPPEDPRRVMRLLQAIAGDDGKRAPDLHRRVLRQAAAKPILLWALAGSAHDEVGRQAAAELVESCQESAGKLALDKFLASSPTLVRHRLEVALGTPNIPEDARKFGSNVYYVFDHAMPWFAAKKYCELLGGHLVTITSTEEQAFVQGLPLALNKGHRFWIGFADLDCAGRGEWVTGEDVTFLNWARGHPDTTKPLWSMRIRVERREPEANFAALGFAPNRWIDAEGEQLKGFVCEWER
ncbi:MAG: transglutaminase domain-containing protein [Planctomycetota bacterium]